MRRTEIVERIRQEARKLSPNAQTILYGSEARGDARPDSDIDLLVLVDKDKLTYSDKDRIIAPFYDIELDTGVIISMLIMPRKEWENRPFLTPFQNNVNKEGITLCNLFDSRQRGDYDEFVYNTCEEVDELYPKAQRFIEEVDALLC